MRPFLTSRLRAAALAACSTFALAAHAQAPAAGAPTPAVIIKAPDTAPVPLASFFDNASFTGAQLSPNATALAVRFGGSGQRQRLAVINLATSSIKVVGYLSDGDVGEFQWVNDNRLVFTSGDRTVGAGEVRYGPGLFAVDRDGANPRQLVSTSADMGTDHSASRALLPYTTFLVRQNGRQDNDSVYVTSPKYAENGDVDYVNLLHLNTLTGRTTTVERPAATTNWLLDHQGEPRLATSLEKNIKTVWYRDAGAGDNWRKLVSGDVFTGGKGVFTPIAFAPDGTLYVETNAGADKQSLHTYDFATSSVKREAVVELADYDFQGGLVTTQDKLLGVRYLSDAYGTIWYDKRMQAIQADIDKRLPNTVNTIGVAPRAATPWVLVSSYSDQQPSRYTLYNTETQLFNFVGDSRPAIDARRMGTQEAVRYTARDGLVIPAWLTLPHGSTRKNLPMVVLVHGGPYVRGGSWGWNADAQFLASRGYAVLEPEYRGSTGFGSKHFRAGWKQWGLAMQDDIADGAKWAIKEGIVDPKRICIAGASYGGYATLMGLINDPGLYKCGIDWVGVTDIKLTYTGAWSARDDWGTTYRQYGMPKLVGDLVKDAAQLQATSPIEQAARITQPLLLAYGGSDMRVPIYHGTRFYDAVSKTNKDVEWVVYGEEGHGFRLPKNSIDFWGRVEKFLDRNIGH